MAKGGGNTPGKKASMTSGAAARPSWDKTNKSFTFQYVANGKSQEVTLVINPENYTQTEPARVTITQTKGGMFVDHFGQGIKIITLAGITGYAPRKSSTDKSAEELSGQEHFIKLRKMYRDWLDGAKENPSKHILRFYNWSDDESFEIAITSFGLQRTVGRPLLYQYNIQITCVKDLSVKPTDVVRDPATELLKQSRERAKLVEKRLVTETSFLSDIIDGIGLENFSAAVKTWSTSVATGTEFLDSVSGTYRRIDSVILDVENLARDIEMFVNASTTFVTKPFELVKDIATSIGDVLEQIVSIADVPHEVVRSFREMVCAISALPQSIFKGFTNPELFEGASNCGSTMGIKEAAVAAYRNSFSATAQVPPERSVTQIFRSPQTTIVINEEPLKVLGVYLETDVSRNGENYLDSYRGTEITLSSVPSSAVVVDYLVKQETTQNMIQLSTAFAYVVKSGDTLPRIALNSYGDASRWKEIAIFNDLEYPFIVEDEENFEIEEYATGSVRFYRATGASGAITIPLGHAVWVPTYQGTNQINFVTTETKILGLMESYVDVSIKASVTGDIGNVASGNITGFTAITGIGSISNILPTTGGKIWKIAFVGDVIQIPETARGTFSAVVPATLNYEELFGIDICVDENGELDSSIESEKDFARVYGVKNLVQALTNRIKTSKSYYPYHPEYGTNLPLYIGQKSISIWHNMIKVDIKDGVLLDPRISQIRQFKMVIDGDMVGMEFDAIPINEKSSLPINIII